jgi:mannosyltransferase
MFFALVLASHVLAAVLLRRRVLASALSVALVGLICSPFISLAVTQRAQVDWIPDRSVLRIVTEVVYKQFFEGGGRPYRPPTVILACLVVLAVFQFGLAIAGTARGIRNEQSRQLLVLSVCIVTLPLTALLLVNFLFRPVYIPRYLTFTAPAFALIVALGFDKLRDWRPAIFPAALGLAVTLSLAPQFSLKSLVDQPPDTERGIAATVSRKVTSPASIVYQYPRQRRVSIGYPEAFLGLPDLSLNTPVAKSGTLWGTNKRIRAGALAGRGHVWLMGPGSQSKVDLAVFTAAGCRQVDVVSTQQLLLIGFDCPRREPA